MSAPQKSDKPLEKPVSEEPKPEKPEKSIPKTIFNGNPNNSLLLWSLSLDLKLEILLLEKVLANKDARQISRIFKSIRKFKKHLKSHHFVRILECFYPEKSFAFLRDLADFKPDWPENFDLNKGYAAKLSKIPEIDLYLQTLFLIYLVQAKQLPLVRGKLWE